jgi:branched-chain amino acid transport system permease protein
MTSIADVASIILTGLITGSIYGLMGLGLSVILGTLRLINMAHGALIMVGMYVIYWFFVLFDVFPLFTVILAAMLFFGLGALFQFTFVETGRHLSVAEIERFSIVSTFGLAALLEGVANTMWSPDVRDMTVPSLSMTVQAGNFVVSTGRLLAAAITLTTYLLLYIFLKRTYTGMSIRALIQDRRATNLMGVNVTITSCIAGGLGIALTGIGGGLLAPIQSFYPSVGWQFLLYSFVIVVLGGMGNVVGSLIAGLVVGVVEAVTVTFTNTLAIPVVVLCIFLVILRFKPEGIFK